MKKIRFTKEFKIKFSEKLMDLGNIGGSALVFGQFIGNRELSLNLLTFGLIFMIACYIISYIISN